jgi:hypothetical protein
VKGFNQNWNFSTDFHKKVPDIKFHKNASSGSRAVLMRTDDEG